MQYLVYILVVAILAGLDQISKYLIVKNFSLHDSINIIDNFFDITYIQNYGAGFSIFQNQKVFLCIVGFIAIGVLSYLLITSKKEEILNKVSFLLIISGTIGNLIDRIRLGYVVDFLDFLIFNYDFPVFNVADCFITIGCFLLIILIIKESKHANN